MKKKELQKTAKELYKKTSVSLKIWKLDQSFGFAVETHFFNIFPESWFSQWEAADKPDPSSFEDKYDMYWFPAGISLALHLKVTGFKQASGIFPDSAAESFVCLTW